MGIHRHKSYKPTREQINERRTHLNATLNCGNSTNFSHFIWCVVADFKFIETLEICPKKLEIKLLRTKKIAIIGQMVCFAFEPILLRARAYYIIMQHCSLRTIFSVQRKKTNESIFLRLNTLLTVQNHQTTCSFGIC